MTATIISDNDRNTIQTEQPYHCPECGAPIPPRRILHYSRFRSPNAIHKPLDDFEDHVNYLHCVYCHCCSRVARLGNAILPFDWPDNCDAEQEARTVAQALARIVQEIGPQGTACDPAAAIVYRLIAGTLAPQLAITQIRELVDRAMAGALLVDEAMPVFEVEVGG
jgi:hypothetical protein